MVSGPITSWQMEGKKLEAVTDFIFLGCKITVGSDWRCSLLGRKALTNLDSILKSRDKILPTKFCIIKAMVLPVIIYRCKSWTIKKAEHWGNDVFKLRCWRSLLRVSWTTKKSNQSILKEINPEYSLEVMMCSWSSNTLATWWKEQTHWNWKRPWSWEKQKAKGDGGSRGWDGWMALLTQWTWICTNSGR